MFENTGSLCVLPLLLVMSYHTVCSFDVDATRVFLEPVMFKKSCRSGMSANKDYFVVKGLINISKLDHGFNGNTIVLYSDRRRNSNNWIDNSFLKLKGVTCRNKNTVKIDSCTCTYMDPKYVRILCNFTAKSVYSQSYICLYYAWKGRRLSSSFQLPTIFENPTCTGHSVNRATQSHPGSFSAVLGTALLGMAVIFLVSSIFSQV